MKEMIRVLIADDSAAFGKACQKELKSGGFDCVLTQKDGNRVISLLDTQHFDVVVMDVFMSGADAMEVLEHMEPMAEKPLVLLLSSMDTPEFEEQMIRAGADYMLIKPGTAPVGGASNQSSVPVEGQEQEPAFRRCAGCGFGFDYFGHYAPDRRTCPH